MAYQPLTLQQFQSAKNAGFSPGQIIANEKIRQQKENAQPQPQQQTFGQKLKASLSADLNSGVQHVKNIASDVGQDITGAGHAFVDTLANPLADVMQGKKTSGLKVAAGGFQAAGQGAKAILSPVTRTVSEGANAIGNQAANIPGVQNIANSKVGNALSKGANIPGDKYTAWATQHSDAAKNLEALGNLAQLAVAIPAGGKAGSLAKTGLDTTAEVGKNAAVNIADKTVGQSALVRDLAKTEAKNVKYGEQIKSQWSKPTTIAKPAYSKATEIFNKAKAKGSNIDETLLKNKINPADNIDKSNYSTTDTAAKIRADAGKMSSDLLKPSLQVADTAIPKTSVADIINKTIADLRNSKIITAGDMETQIARAQKEGAALAKKYPNGMGLTEMHDQNITYNQNGGFSPVKDPNVNNTASMNRAFARTLDKIVTEKAPEGIPVKAFKAELAKQYHAANYLDALNGKKAPVSLGSRIANTAGKVTGAAVGHGLGGGILGGVGGYHIGGMIESMFENLPNPFKRQFLNNLQQTNPEAFSAVSDYIGSEKLGQLTRKALPAPNYMEAQPKTPPQGATIKVTPAETGLGRVPKGSQGAGQVKRIYKSTSK